MSPNTQSPQKRLREFLLTDDKFARLNRLQAFGWKDEGAEQAFKNQRKTADHADQKMQNIFMGMMVKISQQMHQATGALTMTPNNNRILDLCMAPGGFMVHALRNHPERQADAITLPINLGGHKVLAKSRLDPIKDGTLAIHYADITTFASAIGFHDLPPDHPDTLELSSASWPFKAAEYSLIFCDGQVLRNHTRPDNRDDNSKAINRLFAAQLAIALQNVCDGGTIIMKLHRAASWHNFTLTEKLSRFSDVLLHKPTSAHVQRSSYYLVAKNIQKGHEGLRALAVRYQQEWYILTFHNTIVADDDDAGASDEDLQDAHALVDGYAAEYLELVRGIFKIQLDALEKQPWAKKFRTGGGGAATRTDMS